MPKLFMVLLGCKPAGRLTEQHDVFFGIGENLKELIPVMKAAWPEAKGDLHIDSWREVTRIDQYAVKILPKNKSSKSETGQAIFFVNLGGYKPGEFEELHYKLLLAATSKSEAIKKATDTAFYKHNGFKGAASHIDDKYGIDVDDAFEIQEVLQEDCKNKYTIVLESSDDDSRNDVLHIGYLQIKKLLKNK